MTTQPTLSLGVFGLGLALSLAACGDRAEDDTGAGPGDDAGGDDAGDDGGDDAGDDGGDDTGDLPVEPGSETVSVSWDVDLFSLYESPKIEPFDTWGGRRQLDAMTINVDHTAVMTVSLENGTSYALVPDDYVHELTLISIIQIGTDEGGGETDEGPPFFGPGAFSAVSSVDLAAADETRGTGPDYFTETLEETVVFEARYDPVETPRYLEALTGTEPVQLVVGGFSESWVYWGEHVGDDALLYAGTDGILYRGTMTVEYEFSAAD